MTSDEILERNKELAARLVNDLFYTNPPRLETIDEVVHVDYIQHNPAAGQGREGLREFVTKVLPQAGAQLEKMNASEIVEINLVAQGDLVVRQEVRKDWMLVDIFRVRDGWLVEHWDAMRTGPAIGRVDGF